MFITPTGFMRADSVPMVPSPAGQHLFRSEKPVLSEAFSALRDQVNRGENPDFQQLAGQLVGAIDEISRGITTSITAFPVRENLEAEAKILVPIETPVRNMLPRVPGAGTAAAWKQLSALGGGWGSGTNQPGGGSATQFFFAESGAPGSFTSTYVNQSAAYKLMGSIGSVTGFAMATGANFQNQYATEKRNILLNTMLNEENALINGTASSSAAPWGDGTNNLAYNGLINLITTANGCPSANITTSVGALSFTILDGMLEQQWFNGGRKPYFLFNAAQTLSLRSLISNSTSAAYRVVVDSDNNNIAAGLFVDKYVHPITGELVPIFTSRFMPAGTIILGAQELPDGSPAAQVDVLPQVQLPELAPNDQIQGYVAQEIAPTVSSPQVFAFLISCYSVLKLKAATVFCKATGAV